MNNSIMCELTSSFRFVSIVRQSFSPLLLACNSVDGVNIILAMASADIIVSPIVNIFILIIVTSYQLPSFHANTFLKCWQCCLLHLMYFTIFAIAIASMDNTIDMNTPCIHHVIVMMSLSQPPEQPHDDCYETIVQEPCREGYVERGFSRMSPRTMNELKWCCR